MREKAERSRENSSCDKIGKVGVKWKGEKKGEVTDRNSEADEHEKEGRERGKK